MQILLTNSLTEQRDIPFASLKVAKQWQRNLYAWLRHYPEIKARTSIRLDESIVTLHIIPRGKTEKRGRSKL